jgi:enoyl-CoA hydratase
MDYQNIRCELRGAGERKVGLITLDRPKALNALNDALMDELGHALRAYEADAAIGCIVLTGSEKAFAAGADISAMAPLEYTQAYRTNFIGRNWETMREVRKPVIAAVAGFALGGGCELAMLCDFIIAADTAKFGQPEIKIGIFPGAGGTQRLPRAISKSKAMDLILTGRMMDAAEAERAGLVSRVVPAAELLDTAIAAAETICSYSAPSVMMAKECVNRAWESPLAEGILFERRSFHAVFATHDQKEGMNAFLEKRAPRFEHR